MEVTTSSAARLSNGVTKNAIRVTAGGSTFNGSKSAETIGVNDKAIERTDSLRSCRPFCHQATSHHTGGSTIAEPMTNRRAIATGYADAI